MIRPQAAVIRSLTSCQRHTSDSNSLKKAFRQTAKCIGVYNFYMAYFFRFDDFRSYPLGGASHGISWWGKQ